MTKNRQRVALLAVFGFIRETQTNRYAAKGKGA